MYKHFSKFVVRAPLNTLEELYDVLSDDKKIIDKLSIPIVKEAIFWASPDLSIELSKLLSNKDYNTVQKSKIIYSLLKYYIRLSSRCTPFGLFAGCSLGIIGSETKIELSTDIDYCIRLDMNVLYALSEEIHQCEEIFTSLNYKLNSSIYRLGKSYRYIEKILTNDGHLRYKISSIQQTEYLEEIIKKSSNWCSYNELYESLMCDDVDEVSAKEYINELIKNNIIVSELSPRICGEDYFKSLVDYLSAFNNKKNASKNTIIEDIVFIKDCLSLKNENYQSIFDQVTLKLDNMGISYNKSQVFQVDMNKNSKVASIGNHILDELKSALEFLNKTTTKVSGSNLDYFCKVFYDRYEEREMPLLLAIDTEIGIGYPIGSTTTDINPLIDQLILPKLPPKRSQSQTTEIEHLLQRKLIEYEINKSNEIVFDDEDVKNLKMDWNDLPDTFYVLCQIFNHESNYLISLNSISGSSAANLLSRFSYCNPLINSFVQEIVTKEDEIKSEFVLAEIVHLPNLRAGNIITRPNMRKYEIICSANSEIQDEFQIPLSDLFISVKNGKLYLRSKKLNKFILPRLTTAHNYLNNPITVYRFLCDYQYYHTKKNSLYFDWGSLGSFLNFKPRVKYKNVILSVATWKISYQEINSFILNNVENEYITKIRDWRKLKHIPQYTLFKDNDNKLLVDWENKMSILAFYDTLKKSQDIILEEFLYDNPNSSIVRSSEGHYTNEFIFSFYRDQQYV